MTSTARIGATRSKHVLTGRPRTPVQRCGAICPVPRLEGASAMQGDPEVIEFLNEQLTGELTAINQYFLHAKLQDNHGWTKLAKYTRHESFDEVRHAEVLTDRILFLDGLPNYQRLFHVRVGQTVKEMFEADRQVEIEAIDRLKRGIEVMRAKGDITSANIFESILADEEHHIDYLDTQLELLEKLGEPLYIAQLIEQPES